MSVVSEIGGSVDELRAAGQPDKVDNQPPARKALTGWLQIAAVALLVGGAVILSREPQAGIEPTAVSAASAPARLVSVISPEVSPQIVSVSTTGSVTVRSYVALATQVSGRVMQTSNALRNGSTFSAGEELLALETTDFELAVAQADAEVQTAKANLRLREAEGAAATTNYGLLHPGKPVPPLVAKTPQADQARAQLAAALARRDRVVADFQRSRLSLPFAGRVVESSAEVGQLLNASQPFGRVFALDAVEVTASLSPQELKAIAPAVGRKVIVRAGDTIVQGTIDRVSAELDSRSRFAQVFISLEDGHDVSPGTFVAVDIEGPVVDEAYTLPESALQVGELFWVVEDGKLRSQQASIRARTSAGVIVDAFPVADGIVHRAIPGASEGMAVRTAAAR